MKGNFFRKKSPLLRAGLYILVIIICIYSFFPIYWMFISGTKASSELFHNPSLIPGPFTLEYYTTLLQVTDYPRQFMNSVLTAFGTMAITLVSSIMIAYAVSRYQIRGKTIIIGSMLYAYMFPPLLLAIPLFSIFAKIGIADTLFSLVVAHTTIALPLGVWLLWGFFKGMPFELEEAAMVDGYTRLGAFLRVILPLSLPGLVTVAIFSFLLSWTDYTYALIMITSDTNKTLPVGLAGMVGAYELRWGEIMAGATLIALPLLALFTFLSRYFIQGLTAGALKA
jgi:ABC-type glycerol-3-phosphate transport system permease component